MCEWFIETKLCFNTYLKMVISISGVLPGIIYIALVSPHDCFECLSLVPEMRISNFQLNKGEVLRRKYHTRHGGLCSCFPTFSKKLKSSEAVERFERKGNLMAS